MSATTRVRFLVGAAAAVVAAATVGTTLLYDDAGGARAREGAPPFLLEPVLEPTREQKELRRAAELYARDEREGAREIFERYRSVEARVGAALARWPRASTRRLEALAREHPRDAFVRLHLGLARFWERDDAAAAAAWERAVEVDPDSLSAVRADDLLHPQFARGRPSFVASFAVSQADAEGGGQRGLIAKGMLAQRLGKPISARKAFDAAARLTGPLGLDAEVAAAVARFDKADPQAAFSRLGPLSRTHPNSALVRLHLGILLLWMGDLDPARAQLEKAVAAEPGSRPAREAKRFLERLEGIS